MSPSARPNLPRDSHGGTRAIHAILGAFRDAIAVFAPVDCAGCGRADRSLCLECYDELEPAITPRALQQGTIVYTALRYQGVVRQAILALKEEGRTDVARALAKPFGTAIAKAVTASANVAPDGAPIELIAVPTSRSAWRRRGYDPVALLGRRAGYDLARELRPARTTAAQKSLDLSGRARNVEGSLVARRSLSGRRFVLLDDVLTTGSTFAEASRAISDAGGTVVAGAALAFTPRVFAETSRAR
jgi:ComF family protein